MPKVTKPKARKDYPQFGIVKGQVHYHWILKTGPWSSREYRQATPPNRSQLTTSDYYQQVYSLFDYFAGDLAEDIRSLGEAVRELGQE